MMPRPSKQIHAEEKYWLSLQSVSSSTTPKTSGLDYSGIEADMWELLHVL